jgi:hypothetical protein
MIASIEQFTKLLDAMSIPENEKNELIILVTPCFDFRDFLKKKYGLDDMSIEHLIQLKIAAKREYVYGDLELLDTEDVTHLVISRMSRTISEFAKIEEYKNYEGLELALKKVLMLAISQQSTSILPHI